MPKAIVLLGKYKSTSSYEEEEAVDSKIHSYGIALLDHSDDVGDCNALETSSIDGRRFSICVGGVGECLTNKGKYCPFIQKGTPLGTVDLYIRHEHMNLMSTTRKEDVTDISHHLRFLQTDGSISAKK